MAVPHLWPVATLRAVATWAQFLSRSDELGQLAERRMAGHALVLLGTLRGDGWPRISPVESLVLDGQLLLGMMWQSRKALDLLRDPRCVVHSQALSMDGTDGDVKLYGRALDVADERQRDDYGGALYEAIGWRPDGEFHLFAVDLVRAGSWQVVDGEPVSHTWHDDASARSAERRSTVDLVRFERDEPERRGWPGERRGG